MIKNINKLSLKDKSWVGGKAWNLNILSKSGFAVPEAFVIHPSFDISSNKNEILDILKKLDCDRVSVRSSATLEDSISESFAGQFDTFLNINEKNLISMIQKCRDSVNSDRVKSYIKKKKIDPSKLQVAVIIQKMIQSDRSGVAFSVDPIKQNPNHIVVEIIEGLGERLVSGENTPSRILFDKRIKQVLFSTLDVNISNELFETILKIEEVYKSPVDVEFCYKNKKLYILQARPVTTFHLNKPTLKSFGQKLRDEYWKKGSIWEFDWYIDCFFAEEMAYGSDPIHIGYDQAIIGDLFLDLNSDFFSYSDAFTDLSFLKKLIQRQESIITEAKDLLKKLKNENFDTDQYEKVQRRLSLLMASVSVAFDPAMSTEIKNIAVRNKVNEDIISGYILEKSSFTKLKESNNNLSKILPKSISNLNYEEISPEEKEKLSFHAKQYGWLNTGERGGKVWTAKDFFNQFIELSRLVTKLEKTKNLELQNKDKAILDFIIQISLNDNIAADLQVELDFYFQKYLSRVLKNYYREDIIEKLTYEEILEVIKKPSSINEYKDRLNLTNICWQENGIVIKEYVGNKTANELSSYLKDEIPLSNSGVYGSVAYKGIVEGIAYVIKQKDDVNNFPAGYIMVASKTQPQYVPAMTKAIAIVTDIGGITSHASIISREFKIPTVVGTNNASKIIKTGDRIRVDANKGEVTILEKG